MGSTPVEPPGIADRLYKFLYPDPYLDPPELCATHFDVAYYDKVLHKLHSQLYLTKKNDDTVSYFDDDLFRRVDEERTKRRLEPKTSTPEVHTHFDTKLFDDYVESQTSVRTKFNEQYGFDSTQDRLDFKTYFGMSQDEAWDIFDDYIDPYSWATLMRRLDSEAFLDLEGSPQCAETRAKKTAASLQLELNSLAEEHPQFACIARTTAPDPQDMYGAFLTQGSPEESTPIVLDTGASISVSPFKADFVGDIKPLDVKLTGLSEAAAVAGLGWVEWTVRDYDGKVARVRTQAYHVPKASIRLLSPQHYFRDHKDNDSFKGKCSFDADWITLTVDTGQELTFPFDGNNNLPYMLPDRSINFAGCDSHFQAHLMTGKPFEEANNILLEENHNLSPAGKELILWHQRLGHAGYGWLQSLMTDPPKLEVGELRQPPVIPTRNKATKECTPPKCAACHLARQHRRGPGSSITSNKPNMEMAIRRDDLVPGQRVSTDQYVCADPGRLPHTYGKERVAEKYHGGTLFYDHASSFIYLSHQVSLGIGETLQSKRKFERFASQRNVDVRSYRADNHPYSSKGFLEDLEVHNQTITFSGVGAHHQNGAAERALQTCCTWARALMMHQLLHWPDSYDPQLWPFALTHAVHIWNNLPKEGALLTPIELFSGMKQPHNGSLLRTRVWGCPAWVLNPKLQDLKKIPKWSKRSRCGMYLGHSDDHHSTVGQILNLRTGAVSPQFHVVYDELYATVFGRLTEAAFDAKQWNSLIRLDGDRPLGVEHNSICDRPRTFSKRAALDRVAQDLFDTFVNPDHTTPLPPPVPEGEGTVTPYEEGTSVSEGVSAISFQTY